jgi:hypothetical protein
MKMRKGGRVLLAVLNLYVGIKIHVATFESNHSFIDITQSFAGSIQKLPDSSVKSFSRARHRVGVSGEAIRFSISLSLAVNFFTRNVHKR